MICESRPLCAVVPLPGSPGFPAPLWGGFRLGRDPGAAAYFSAPKMGQSPPVRARRQTRTGGARNGKCRLLRPCCRLGRCSHTSSSARPMALQLPLPPAILEGERGGGGLHSEAKSAPSARWGEEPIPRERPPPPANSRTLSEGLAAAEGLKQLMERGWRERAQHTKNWKVQSRSPGWMFRSPEPCEASDMLPPPGRCLHRNLGSGKIHWRREWPPTPVFLPGESHGQRSLGGLQSIGSQRVCAKISCISLH